MTAQDGNGEVGLEEIVPETEEEREHREVQTQINSAVTEVSSGSSQYKDLHRFCAKLDVQDLERFGSSFLKVWPELCNCCTLQVGVL